MMLCIVLVKNSLIGLFAHLLSFLWVSSLFYIGKVPNYFYGIYMVLTQTRKKSVVFYEN